MSALNSIDAAPVAAQAAASIPEIDLEGPPARTAALLRQGCEDWGLFHVAGHGIGADLLAAVHDTSRTFFARPWSDKQRLSRTAENPWGYFDRELTKTRRDRKQIFDIACHDAPDAEAGAPFGGDTPWPDEPAAFRMVMTDYAGACEALSQRLLAVLAGTLGITAETLLGRFQPSHSSFLRLNYYPVDDALAADLGPSDLGIHHHTDAGALTVLLQDRVSGLQLFKNGLWHDVAPLEGALTVNIGDMVQVWSNDRYAAPIHRVRAMTREDRLSTAFFYNPSYAAVIAPETVDAAARYRPFGWGEFRAGRAAGDFANYGTEVQISDYRV
jgi:isopenicillin N synthase-like dioxygenase